MIISSAGKDQYTVKIKNKNIDIFDYDEVLELIQQVMKKIIDINLSTGIFDVKVYTNYDYGIIMNIDKVLDNDEEIDIKLHFYIDSLILVKTDYFYLKETNVKNKIVYYFDKNFYTAYNDDILEYSDIAYGQKTKEIITKGIKLTI